MKPKPKAKLVPISEYQLLVAMYKTGDSVLAEVAKNQREELFNPTEDTINLMVNHMDSIVRLAEYYKQRKESNEADVHPWKNA